jgi:hypothetical protein
MHIVLWYIYSTNVYSLLKVGKREFHVFKIEGHSQFATNPFKALKQLAINLH